MVEGLQQDITQEKLPGNNLITSADLYLDLARNRLASHENSELSIEAARRTIIEAIVRNNQMSEILASEEYGQIEKRTKKLMPDCRLGAITCIDGRMALPLIFGTMVDVSKQKAAVLPTTKSVETDELSIDSSTVKIAVINAPMKDDPNLLEFLVGHVSSREGFKSNCAAAKLIRDKLISDGQDVNSDLIKINQDAQKVSAEAVDRTYNSSAKQNEKQKLEKVAIRVLYDTDSMGIVLGYGEKESIFTTELTKEFSGFISSLSSSDARLQNPGALRYSYTDLNQFINNENTYLTVIEALLENDSFVSRIDNFCNLQQDSEVCGLNESQKQGLRYVLARNIAFQYLTGVHLEQMSPAHPFSEHAEKFMSISLDDGHGMTVGAMDPESQSFNAVGSRIQNAIDHIQTMYSLMDHNGSKRPHILFVSRGIEDSVSDNHGALDSVTADLDRVYKEIQKDENIEKLIREGNLIMIPVIQSGRTGKIIDIITTPLI